PTGETYWDLLAETADGIGLSGMRDLDSGTLDAARSAANVHGKPFAIHVSEDQRDDMDAVLALEPDFVVHMCQGTAADFQALADADVPVVLCPRSNRYFGLKTPAKELLQAGATVAIGTDNGMLADGNLLQELALLQSQGIAEEDLLRMASHSGRYLLGLEAGLPPRRGAPLEALLLPHPAIPAGPAARPVFRERGLQEPSE
ncbi:MAG: amidohydrolase family protein, partial [Thermoplasmatota archaeon]